MNRVALAFRERVAAFWKCCDEVGCGGCHVRRRIPDWEWTRISRKRRIVFHIGTENGKWIYGFGDPEGIDADRYLTMAELKNYPNLKNIVIRRINVFQNWRSRDVVTNLISLDFAMEVLMKFVSFLSNEPRLVFTSSTASTGLLRVPTESFDAPQGRTLLQWLEKMHLSSIFIQTYEAKYKRLLERQYSRRKVIPIEVISIESGREFLEAEIAALRIRKCYIFEDISTTVMDTIVKRFLMDPSQFGEDYKIKCHFRNDIVKNLLKGYKEKNQCTTEDDFKFTFRGPKRRILTVKNKPCLCRVSLRAKTRE